MGLFSPKPPVDEDEKYWIETSMLRLTKMFGMEKLQRPTILPLPKFFPDRFMPTEEGIDVLVKRVCTYMDVNFEQVFVYHIAENSVGSVDGLLGQKSSSGAAGLYSEAEDGKYMIGIREGMHTNPGKLVATIAHELAHVLLLGSGKVSRDEEDHEYLTDLMVVYSGLGIFTANAVFTFTQRQNIGTHGWSSSKAGYMTEPMLGYALACYCWMRGEVSPDWERLLSANPRDALRKGLKFLAKTQQTDLPRG